MYKIKILNLKTCLVFEATWKTFVKNEITEKEYISIKTPLHIKNTHTRWNADIEFHKIHLAYQAHESTHKMKCTLQRIISLRK